jgi:AraC-like DNA-binding protein
MNSLTALLAAAAKLPAEKYIVDRPVDERGQYQRRLAVEFPFEINRLRFSSRLPRPLTWHAYLEIFVLLSSECRRRMGDSLLHLTAGDVLIMDHLRLHAVDDFPGDEAEAIVIRFTPEIVRSAAATASELLLLLPFYCHIEGQPHLIRAGEPAAAVVHTVLAQLIERFATAAHSPYGQPGARAYFLVLLTQLAHHFHAAEQLKSLFDRQQVKIDRLQKVFAYVDDNYADPIALPPMAALAGLSTQRFYMLFKKAAGMTLVEYVTQVRRTHAAQFLQGTARSIAEIASAVGFSDQSYFDRRFRRHFGRTPSQFRKGSPADEPRR